MRAPVGQSVLSAVYLAEPSTKVITPYSSAVVVDAQTADGLTASNVAAAATRVPAFLGGVDPQQTPPAFMATGTAASTSSTVADGNRMAFALGAESQSRVDNDLTVAASVQSIVVQSANGDTLADDACYVPTAPPTLRRTR